jgi:hypothetical protein
MSARSFGMHHRTVVPENFERPSDPAEELDEEAEAETTSADTVRAE